MNDYAKFEDLKGKTLTKVTINERKDEIVFECTDGSKYRMYHEQDCCESVSIEDICGDLQCLINHKILEAYESGSTTDPAPYSNPESYTWTYYRIRTMYDTVVIRWYGTSNGYYSESVDFVCTKEADLDNASIPEATRSYFTLRDNAKKFLDAIEKNNQLKIEVLNWIDDIAKQGHVRQNKDAPMWDDYQNSIVNLYVTEANLIPDLVKLVHDA